MNDERLGDAYNYTHSQKHPRYHSESDTSASTHKPAPIEEEVRERHISNERSRQLQRDIWETTLTREEICALRNLLKARERIKWLWGLLKVWLGYLTAGTITLFVLWEHLEKFLLKVLE